MNHPNHFLIQRRALARFKRLYPFLALIPPVIYHEPSPLTWYEPFGEIEQARQELEEELDSYVMLFKHYGPEPPRETQLFAYLQRARLTPEQHAILTEANEYFQTFGIACEVYEKPLRLRACSLNPFEFCSPPDDEAQEIPDGIDPNDLPF